MRSTTIADRKTNAVVGPPGATRFLGYEVGYFAWKYQIGRGAAEYIISNIGNDREKLDAVGVLFAKL